MGNAIFQSAMFSVVKKSRNFWLMKFVELRILYLIDVSRNLAVQSLKRSSEMQIYSKSENTNRVLHICLLPKI